MKHRIQSLMIVLFLISTCGYGYAGTVTINYGSGNATQSIQNTSGGATSQTITPTASDPATVNPDVFAPPPVPLGAPPAGGAAPAPALGVGIGATAIWSPNVQVYAIPASYSLTKDLKVGINIPFIEKQLTGEYTGEELTARGLGDVSVDVRYRYGNENFVQGISAFSVKLPTGSYKQFEGRREILSLGTGSYDVMINQTFSKTLGKYHLVANVGYRWNMKSDYTETNNFGLNIKYENREGNMFNYLAGVSYVTPIRGLRVYCNVAGLFIDRSDITETNNDTGVILRDEVKKDRLMTLDVIPGVKLQFTEKIGFRLGIVIPTLTGYDPDTNNPEERDWAVDAGMAALF